MNGLHLPGTKAAIEIYDKADEEFSRKLDGDDYEAQEIINDLDHLEKLEENVGYTYGLETSDFNNPETCKSCIRPGTKVAQPGCELSFVRRMVIDYEAN